MVTSWIWRRNNKLTEDHPSTWTKINIVAAIVSSNVMVISDRWTCAMKNEKQLLAVFILSSRIRLNFIIFFFLQIFSVRCLSYTLYVSVRTKTKPTLSTLTHTERSKSPSQNESILQKRKFTTLFCTQLLPSLLLSVALLQLSLLFINKKRVFLRWNWGICDPHIINLINYQERT